MKITPTSKTAAMLFVGLVGCYSWLSYGDVGGQGYTPEEMASGLQMLAIFTAAIKGHPVPPMLWSRHGPVAVIFDLPFLKLGKLFISPNFILSFSPMLFTAGLLTVLFLWLRKLCSPAMSLFLVLTAAFGTMLWPYAYIGLETKQSFFVLLAGYLALADGKIRDWLPVIGFAMVSALALSVKGTGILLLPATAYLIFVQFKSDWRSRYAHLVTIILIIGAVWTFNHWGVNAYWGPRGGAGNNLRPLLIDSIFQPFINIIGIFCSPGKGLFVYCPVLLATIYAVPRAFRTNRPIAIYAVLVTICMLGLLTFLKFPFDEVWGCRYLHVAIAPLILCIGAAWPGFRWRGEGSILLLLAMLGFCISFLGAFYYYGLVDFAMKNAGQNTLEWIVGDIDWNHILFDARLFQTWVHGAAPVPWTPTHLWVWTPPANALIWRKINLADYCQPQSFLVRFWHIPKRGVVLRIFDIYLVWLVVGVLSLSGAIVSTLQQQWKRGSAEVVPAHETALP